MTRPTGHESGHPLEAPPRAWTWADVVDALVAERGSLAELARHLQDVAPPSARLPVDPGTIERGLRRLRARGTREGNTYGRLVLRCLGTPDAMTRELQALGQYHSRASDLNAAARLARLRRWDCPPVTESRDAIWVHLALGTVAHQRGDSHELAARVALIRALERHASPTARLETALFLARLVHDEGDRAGSLDHLDAADAILQAADITHDQRSCYLARLVDQRAYIINRSWRRDPDVLHAALDLYDRIQDAPEVPAFARFRRAHGRAWCLWRLGERAAALDAAGLAARHAGDGGFVRFRVMALHLQAHILGAGQGCDALAARALKMSLALGDDALVRKSQRLVRA